MKDQQPTQPERQTFDPEKVGRVLARILTERGLGEVRFVGAVKKPEYEQKPQDSA